MFGVAERAQRRHASTTMPRRRAESRPRREFRQAVSTAILDLCRGGQPAVIQDPDFVSEFVRAVRFHRIAPLAYVRLRDSHPELAAILRHDRDIAAVMHLRATTVLQSLPQLLEGIPWLTFKGPVLSEHAHPVKGLRPYHDLDVLVDPSTLREVTKRLLAAGWSVADFRDMLRMTETPGEMHWMSPAGVLVDLHWSMINMESQRRRFTIGTADLLARRRSVALGSGEVWTLDDTDNHAHVSLHAALSGASRMLLVLDVDQATPGASEHWRDVTRRAREWKAEAPIALALARARRLLGTPVPAEIARVLTGPGSRLINAVTDTIAPVPMVRDEASLPRLVARAARPGGPRTVAAVGGHALLGIRDRTIRRTAEPDTDRAPADSESLDAYLHAVESTL